MREAEWKKATDPKAMLSWLGRRSDRKARLFAVACCRCVEPLLADERVQRVLLSAERMADDGGISTTEIFCVEPQAWELLQEAGADSWPARMVWEAWQTLNGWEAAEATLAWWLPFDQAAPIRGANLLRDLFGTLRCREIRLDSHWCDNTVKRLARAAYEIRLSPVSYLDSERLAVLADALDDAGCDNADILDHLRSPGPHVRGCWALDLLLDKK